MDASVVFGLIAVVVVLVGVAYWALRPPKLTEEETEAIAEESDDIAYTPKETYPTSYAGPHHASPRDRYRPASTLRPIPGKPGGYERCRDDDSDDLSPVAAATIAALDFPPDPSPVEIKPLGAWSVPETPSYRRASDEPGVPTIRYTHTTPDVDTPSNPAVGHTSDSPSYTSHGSSYGSGHDSGSGYSSSSSSDSGSSSSSSSDSGGGSSSC